ncbi:hypothetical protein Pan241w_22180 [Gimesia alba]|uniref:Uncharacterized protein n=1 Tax=Gimesia alba TaxID=2527973 RepID=A0A517RE27_9PLAN|nr:hypothetical protein Pan241w_22180 [Gimesia alba]
MMPKKVKTWEVVLWGTGVDSHWNHSTSFRTEHVSEVSEERARAEARKRYAVNGWSIYSVRQVETVPVDQ